jgi:Ser/Thr protein kinase RdoA (MazF antagonist)
MKEKIIEKIFETLDLGTVKSITYSPSSQNLVHQVKTDKKDYYIKQYSKDAIKNDKDLLNRKRQIAVSEKLSENGVPVILPMSFNNRYLIKNKKDYYLVFEYNNQEPITSKELNDKKIRKLASTLAIIHKLNIISNLNCQYKKININFTKYQKKFIKINQDLYNTLTNNIEVLKELIDNCNNNINSVKDTLCISHNDYKLLNILWKKDFMYLIDFDATSMSNPTVSTLEAAFKLSIVEKTFKKDHYKDFLNAYIRKYEELETDFNTALNVAMNGTLQRLDYLLSKCSKKDQTSIKDTISMINELKLFIDNKEEMINIYNEILDSKKNKKKKKQKK